MMRIYEHDFVFHVRSTASTELKCEFRDPNDNYFLDIIEKPGLVEITIGNLLKGEKNLALYLAISYKWPTCQPENFEELEKALEEIVDFNIVGDLKYHSMTDFDTIPYPGDRYGSNFDREDYYKLEGIIKKCFGNTPGGLPIKVMQTLSRVVKLLMRYKPK